MAVRKPPSLIAGPVAGRFCPNCRWNLDLDELLCRDCGEETSLLAYCDVCEHFWQLPEGTPCPKHDVLLAASPSVPSTVDPERVDWATVKTFSTLPLAEAPRIRLEAEGIPTFLDGERMAGNHILYNTALGGVKLQVPRELVAQARILLDQNWSLPDDDDPEIDDAYEELGPEPGNRRRSIMRAAIVLYLVLPILGTAIIGFAVTAVRLLSGR